MTQKLSYDLWPVCDQCTLVGMGGTVSHPVGPNNHVRTDPMDRRPGESVLVWRNRTRSMVAVDRTNQVGLVL